MPFIFRVFDDDFYKDMKPGDDGSDMSDADPAAILKGMDVSHV